MKRFRFPSINVLSPTRVSLLHVNVLYRMSFLVRLPGRLSFQIVNVKFFLSRHVHRFHRTSPCIPNVTNSLTSAIPSISLFYLRGLPVRSNSIYSIFRTSIFPMLSSLCGAIASVMTMLYFISRHVHGLYRLATRNMSVPNYIPIPVYRKNRVSGNIVNVTFLLPTTSPSFPSAIRTIVNVNRNRPYNGNITFRVPINVMNGNFLSSIQVTSNFWLSTQVVTMPSPSPYLVNGTFRVPWENVNMTSTLPGKTNFLRRVPINIVFRKCNIPGYILHVSRIPFPIVPVNVIRSFFPICFRRSSGNVVDGPYLYPILVLLPNTIPINVVNVTRFTSIYVLRPTWRIVFVVSVNNLSSIQYHRPYRIPRTIVNGRYFPSLFVGNLT